MVKKDNFPKAYKEIYEIIQHLNEKDKNRIPNEFIEMIETKMDRNYVFNYDMTKEISEQQLLRETLSILAFIYINYISEYSEVKEIKMQFQRDIIQNEAAKKAQYKKDILNNKIKDINYLEKTTRKDNIQMNSKEFEKEVSLMDSKRDNWYSKIVLFFKNIFK